MTTDELVARLELPAAARVDRRVPKTLLLEHGAPTAADKRHINEGVDQLQWIAVLKPATIGVAAFRDEAREYLEISVLGLVLRPDAAAARLIELLHRAVPYPVVAIVESKDRLHLSLAHKRWSQGESGKTVLDGELVSSTIPHASEPHAAEFYAALALTRQPTASLAELYQGWLDTVLALEAARLTSRFVVQPATSLRTARAEALQECVRLDAEMARLRAAAKREKQLPRQVDLNLALKRAEAARAAALARL